MKFYGYLAIGGCALALGILSAEVYAYPGEQYANQAKVTMSQAQAEALKQVQVTITKSELEKEAGGSGLRYSFDIRTPSGLHEIGIDAQTGKVLENVAESSQTERQEKRAEQKEHN